jgi:hypothetical protein
MLYLVGHALATSTSLLISQLTFRYQWVQAVFLVGLLLNTINKGASYLHHKMDIEERECNGDSLHSASSIQKFLIQSDDSKLNTLLTDKQKMKSLPRCA